MNLRDGNWYRTLTLALVLLIAGVLAGNSGHAQTVAYSLGGDRDQQVVVIRKDTTYADTVKVVVRLEKELKRIREELERTREKLREQGSGQGVEVQVDMEELMKELEGAMQELERLKYLEEMEHLENPEELERLREMDIQVSISGMDRPFLGVSIDDITFKEAYEMHYGKNYGVYVKGVVPESAADKAGIRKGDIIMEFDGSTVRYSESLKNMIESKSVGDTVKVQLFRDEDIITTNVVFSARSGRAVSVRQRKAGSPATPESGGPGEDWDKDIDEEAWEDHAWDDEEWPLKGLESKFDGFFASGYGGGSWIPVWNMADLSDINGVIDELGFKRLPENGMLMQGGLGKGPVGRGYFIGGMGAGYSVDRKISHTVNRPDTSFNAIRRMRFSTGYGGVTLDKRYRLSENIATGVGFMLGGGEVSMEVSQTSGRYDWTNLPDEISDNGNSYLKLTKSYLIFQPKAMVMYRLTKWLAIRAEAGYLLGYSFKTGWDAKMADDTFEVRESPASHFYDGFTLSIGPWFGF